MFYLRKSIPVVVLSITLASLLFLACGCPSGNGEKDVKVSVVLGSDIDPIKKAASDAQVLDKATKDLIDTVASLNVTITDLSVDYAGTVAPTPGAAVENIPLLSEPLEIDVFHIHESGLSTVLSNVTLPAGCYTALHISFENPELYVEVAGQSVLYSLGFQIASQGTLTINTNFYIPEVNCTLLVDFGGINLSFVGGTLTLTPNITVEIMQVDMQVEVGGIIKTVYTTNNTFTMDIGPVNAKVDYASADIYRSTDTTTPTGTEADLVTGAHVTVTGSIGTDGRIVADKVAITS